MKYLFVLLTLFVGIVVLSESIFAAEILIKDSYLSKETVFGELKGSFVGTPSEEDFKLLRKGYIETPFDVHVERIEGKTFFWGNLGSNPSNYTLKIDNVYSSTSASEPLDLESTFTLLENHTDFNIDLERLSFEDNLYFEIFNFLDDSVEIGLRVSEYEDNLVVKPGLNKFDISLDEIEEKGIHILEIGGYITPIYVDKDTKFNNTSNPRDSHVYLPDLRITPEYLQETVLVDRLDSYPLQFVNYEENDLDVYLDYNSDFIILDLGEQFSISPNERKDFIISFKDFDGKENIDEIIYARSGNLTLEIPVRINFTDNEEDVTVPYHQNKSSPFYVSDNDYRCSELDGEICGADQICQGESKFSSDGVCCIGVCEDANKKNSYSWIGYLLALAIIIVGFYLWKRYKKVGVTAKKEAFNNRVINASKKKLP